MQVPTVAVGAGNRSGLDSLEIRRLSRLHGALYEPAHDEIDCPACGRMFTPRRPGHTHCKICRRKARSA